MQPHLPSRLQGIIVRLVALILLMLLAACGSVAGTSTGTTSLLTGTVVAVNASQHSAVIAVNGQQVTVTGLTDQQVAALQTQVGKVYTLPVTGSGSTVTISAVATIEPTQTASTGPQVTPSPTSATVFVPGSIQFMGTVRTVGPSSITVSMPDGSMLSMSMTALTDRSHYGGGLPPVGQLTKVETTANQNGSFTATKLEPTDANDALKQAMVQYEGVTSSAVSADRVIHFNVGTNPYTFTIGPTADLSDVGGNAQAIQANRLVKVQVQFAGSTGTVLKVQVSNG